MSQDAAEGPPIHKGLLGKIKGRTRWELTRARDAIGDRFFNIGTSWPRATGPIPDGFQAAPYEAIPYAAMPMIAQHIGLNASDVTADLGCGKGRAVCWFATQNIRKSIGVEFDPALSAVAEKNARTFGRRRCPIEIRTGDARDQSYSDVTVVFLFNPFGREIMRRVVERLGEDRAGNPLRIVYVNPLVGDVLDEAPWLSRGETFGIPFLMLGKMNATIWESRH